MRDLSKVMQFVVHEIASKHIMMKSYSAMMTTCIVGNAGRDCNLVSYDEHLSFDKDDILDPEFPLTTEGCCLPDDYYCDRPEHVLMRMCNGLTPTTVNVIGNMER